MTSIKALISVAQMTKIAPIEPPFKESQRSMVTSMLSTHRPINIEVRGEASKTIETSTDRTENQNRLQFVSCDGRRTN
ncbi:MAG: hypothetical protein ACK521_04350 [bacterium]